MLHVKGLRPKLQGGDAHCTEIAELGVGILGVLLFRVGRKKKNRNGITLIAPPPINRLRAWGMGVLTKTVAPMLKIQSANASSAGRKPRSQIARPMCRSLDERVDFTEFSRA